MIKVLVVVWGLVMVVPDGPAESDPEGLTVLFLNSDAWPSLHEHEPSYQQLVTHQTASRLPPNFSGLLKTATTAAIDLTALPHVAPPTNRMTVRRECLDAIQAEEACKLNGTPMVAGRIRFEGLWRTRPASRCQTLVLPFEYSDKALYDFRAIGSLAQPGSDKYRLATALVLETEVEKLSDLTITGILPADHALTALEGTECKKLNDADAPCVIIQLANAPAVQSVDSACRNDPNPPAECRADEHFGAFYDLLEGTPPAWNHRLVPFVVDNYYECRPGGGVGTPPGVRCPPYTAMSAPGPSQ